MTQKIHETTVHPDSLGKDLQAEDTVWEVLHLNYYGLPDEFTTIQAQIEMYLLNPQLIEWNGYETRQTPLLYVFVDLKVHNVQKNSYHFDCIDQ